MIRNLLLVCALVAGCGGEKLPVDDSFSDLAGVDDKSDKFTGRITRIGDIKYGETKSARHQANKWSAFTFLGTKGDELTIDVKSSNGDTVAWLVDKSMEILAYNDDASRSTTNSQIKYTLKDGASTTFYIVVRDYYKRGMNFSVSLKGKRSFDSPCSVDADCALVNAACCGGNYAAVRADQSDAFRESLACDPRIRCALIPPPADVMAQCNNNKCVGVQADDIACGGFSLNPHACPPGYSCQGEGLARDLPGECVKCEGSLVLCAPGHYFDNELCECVERFNCGGFGGFECAPGKECVDNPRDDCDPNNGGADCPGVCVPPDCRNTGCPSGQYCTMCWVSFQCIPNGAVC